MLEPSLYKRWHTVLDVSPVELRPISTTAVLRCAALRCDSER